MGDVMYDSLLYNLQLAEKRSHILESLHLTQKRYVLATVHRAENTDDPKMLHDIFHAFERIAQDGLEVVIPLHPRTRKLLTSLSLSLTNCRLLPPVSYLDMLTLAQHAKAILTDSGGLQKEAYWLKVPCITLRDETEWLETVDTGWNVIVGADTHRIVQQVSSLHEPASHPSLYGDGNSALRYVSLLEAL